MSKRCWGAILLLILVGGSLAAQSAPKIDFARDVQPILKANCYECHGAAQQMRGLRLDRRRDALPNRVGANNARIVPGNSAGSLLYRRIAGDGGSQMPPAGSLRPDEINIIKAWIDQGAEWPDAYSGEVVTGQSDPVVTRMRDALRNGDRRGFQRIIQENPKSINAKGTAAWTPLMYAALYRDPEAVRLLLDRGANPSVQNDAGGTALLYAVEDESIVRLLLDHGADPSVASGEGRTALRLALGWPGMKNVAQLLLDKGAKPSGQLGEAIGARDAGLLQLLLDHGVSAKPSPLRNAVRFGCTACFDLLVKFADPDELSAAMTEAVLVGDGPLTQTLLSKGAKAAPDALQAVALSPRDAAPDLIKTLIDRGGDVNAHFNGGISILDLSRRQGNTVLTDALIHAGAKDETSAPPRLSPQSAASVRDAIDRSLPPLQRADVAFLERAGCISCHNNSLTAMTRAAARMKGVPVDEPIARSQLQRMAAFLDENRERALENEGLPGGLDTVSYILMGMAAEKYPADPLMDVWARYVKNNQSPDGRFPCGTTRPPLESSDFEVTAASVRALRAYGPKTQRSDYDRAVARAVHWLETALPGTNEDRAFKVLGLVWGGGSPAAIQKTAKELLAMQRSDGGWGQLPTLGSDAYATGQALVALQGSRIVAVNDPAYQRGIRFLLNSQLEDGSWYVRSRAIPIQPYFDSDFPHGHDQFISTAATNWAAMALTAALPGGRDR